PGNPEGEMRACVVGLFLCAVVLFPKAGNAQAFAFRTPAPEVTAAASDWQIAGNAIVVSGLVYYPTRAFRMFDGLVMAQVGFVESVPVYADMTLEPFSVVYVPVGGVRMREYERRRDGELAGTTGSRAPSFPVAVVAERAPGEPTAGTSGVIAERAGTDLRTGGVASSASSEAAIPAPVGTIGTPDRSRPRRTIVESIPRPS